jgi:hypothetical protein
VTWSNATTVRAMGGSLDAHGHRIGYYHDGTYLHYAFADAELSGDVFYRRGTLGSNGAITWSAVEQTVTVIGAAESAGYPSVIADSNGNPWVAYTTFSGSFGTHPNTGYVVKSSATDGTWTSAAGFPHGLVTSSLVNAYPMGVALTAGKTYWAWSTTNYISNTKPQGKRWNGTSWDVAEDLTSSETGSNLYTLVADGDAIHVVFHDETDTVKYRRRSAAGTWGSEITISSIGGILELPVLRLISTDYVRIYWVTPTTYLVRAADVRNDRLLTAAATVRDESAAVVTTQHPLQVGVNGNNLLVAYTTKAASPFDIVALLQTGTINAIPYGTAYRDRTP